MSFKLPEQNLNPKRKIYGALPKKITDESQIPSVVIEKEVFEKIKLNDKEENKEGAPYFGGPPKIGGPKNTHDELKSTLKLKVSVDCIRMRVVISEFSKKTNNEWLQIRRLDFEKVGINGDRIIERRKEGRENNLFDFKEVKKISSKTGEEYTAYVLYKLL